MTEKWQPENCLYCEIDHDTYIIVDLSERYGIRLGIWQNGTNPEYPYEIANGNKLLFHRIKPLAELLTMLCENYILIQENSIRPSGIDDLKDYIEQVNLAKMFNPKPTIFSQDREDTLSGLINTVLEEIGEYEPIKEIATECPKCKQLINSSDWIFTPIEDNGAIRRCPMCNDEMTFNLK